MIMEAGPFRETTGTPVARSELRTLQCNDPLFTHRALHSSCCPLFAVGIGYSIHDDIQYAVMTEVVAT
jgi:hypothetical protein